MRKLDPMLPILTARTQCTSYSYLGLLAHVIISKGLFFFLLIHFFSFFSFSFFVLWRLIMNVGHNQVSKCLKHGSEQSIEKIAKEEFSMERGIYHYNNFFSLSYVVLDET